MEEATTLVSIVFFVIGILVLVEFFHIGHIVAQLHKEAQDQTSTTTLSIFS